ncbi:MAG TPA: amino acid adenylation domain-containing protein [Chitinophaga sp.]|uniref:non-ribosomal peptide synthetase n=1 Tax=Chitinophaga sp. TaxID=1869181 RepID=UPI002CA9D802|nr:non-ribosomal peptide synthetase [Chitinophaga sp.]HVI45320.1 amino acid adenylation domain-containing protein [Chitinophaga sp.]
MKSFAVAAKEKLTTDTADLQLAVTRRILEIAAQLLKLSITDIEPDTALGDYGFDSMLMIRFSNDLNNHYDLDLKPTVFYNYPTVEGLAIFLTEEYMDNLVKKHPAVIRPEQTGKAVGGNILQSQGPLPQMAARQDKVAHNTAGPVAIIGMSGRFPGSPDLTTFWNNLRDNKDLIVEIPAERWDWKEYDGDPKTDKNKTRAKWGGFINDADKFDPLFFGISPKEAELMDPQQRITLEAVYHALEDACINVKDLSGSNTGVFIGAYFNDYASLIQHSYVVHDAQLATGISHSILTNRISYLFNLHGPSEPVDTACSSSLVAMHRAVEHIRNGDCDIVITGGVSLDLIPETLLPLSQAGMLSEDGRCKTFDQTANGYVRGEGVGIVILKSLSKAEADGDHIYGVIRGTAENHGGKANTLTSPNPSAQKNLLLKAYRSANINPSSVSYIEAHGTGTPLGDPIETEGLKLAFRELYKEWNIPQPEAPHCGIGSVKTNIGHLEAAAGMASVIKVLLSLRHRILPGNPHLKTPNAYLKLEDSPFRLQKETEEWTSVNNQPRIAGISSFGFGGANAHIIIEEYQPAINAACKSKEPAIIVLSARNEHRIKEQVVNLKRYIEANPAACLHDIAYSLQMGREPMEERIALIAEDKEVLDGLLTDYLAGITATSPAYVFSGSIKKDKSDLLLKGGAGHAYINYAITNRELASIAQLWVKGGDIDWTLLYGHQKPAKISLPVYPFARDRYWFDSYEAAVKPVVNNTPQNKPLDKALVKTFTYEDLFSKHTTGDEIKVRFLKEGIAIVSMEAIATSNMLNVQLMISLKKTLDELRTNSALKVLVLTGSQKVFSMGGDQQGLESIAQSESSVTYFPFLYKGLLEFNVPVISAIQGHAFGGGLILGMYGDIVLLSESSTYSANFMKYGFTPGMGATYILGEKLGKQLATEMMYTARLVSGEEIKRRGASVIVTGDVMKEALQIARELSEKPKNALEALKKKLSSDILNVLDYHVGEEQKMHDLTFHTKEVEALISSHFNKTSVQTSAVADRAVQEIPGPSAAKISLLALDAIEVHTKEEQLSPVGIPTGHPANTAIIKSLKEIFEDVLHVPVTELVEDATFIDLGLDSISGVEILQKINNTFGVTLQGPMLYDNPTLQQLAAKISEESGWFSDQVLITTPMHTAVSVSLTAFEKVVLQPVIEDVSDAAATVTTYKETPLNAPAKKENTVVVPARQGPDMSTIIKTLKKIFEDVLHVPAAELVDDATFIDLGLDSISGVEILQKINNTFSIALQGPTLYDNPTLQQLAGKISAETDWLSGQAETTAVTPFATAFSAEQRVLSAISLSPPVMHTVTETTGVEHFPENGSEEREDIAVVGMDGLFPGSDTPEKLWAQVLLNKRISLSAGENAADWHSIDAAAVETYAATYAQKTKSSQVMSRQYQLVFGVLGRLMDTAGITRKALSGSRTGVFIAISQVNDTSNSNVEYSSENVAAMLPAKISYEYNLTGPCEVINAACTSSYLTLHKAVQSIRMGECDQAIVGGINVISSETANYEGLTDLGKLLSREGEMRSFEDDADGIVRSEGVGIIIIKRLAAAKADKNTIYALIKGTYFAHGGKNLSWEAPNPKGIKEVVRRSLEQAGVNPATIDYVEAHGIANRMADAVELGAINDIYRELSTDATKKWYVSSIKPIVGHAELASGMASLIKVIKALQHKTIPGIPGFTNINSELAPGHSMLLQSGAVPWKNGRYPRRAALNSYAVGGVNAHVILEEYKGAITPGKSAITTDIVTADAGKDTSPADNDIEYNTQLSAITREIFGIDMAEIDRALSLVDYDFDSVKVIRFIREINDVFGLDIKMGQVLGVDNFGVLFDLLIYEWKKKVTEISHSGSTSATSAWMTKKYPLSEGQKGLWFIQHLEPGDTTYNLPIALILEGEVDTVQLREALMSVMEDHPVLRSNFIRDIVTGEICHKINTPSAALFFDYSLLEKNEDVKNTFWQLLRKPFNLESDCLLRLYLKRDPDTDRTYLLFVTHHIVFDGTSSALFMAAVFEKSKQRLKRENKTEKQPNLAYFNFVTWEQEYIASSRGAASLSYWREKLSGNLPLLSLPYDTTLKEINTAGVGCGVVHLKKQELDELKLVARKLNVNLSVLFLSAFTLLLNRLTGEEDILVLTPIAGRPGKEYEQSIGYYVNMMITRSNVSSGKQFQQLAGETKQEFVNGIDYAAYPFPQLVSTLNLYKGNGREAAFKVAYSYHNIFDKVLEGSDFGVTLLDGLYQETAFDYSLEINDLREELIVNLKYNRGIFYAATIERHLGYFRELLKGIAENPVKALKDYKILPEEEYHELVVTRNSTAVDYPRHKTLIDLFEEQVARTPDQIAVVFKEERITYKALHDKASRLANYLKKAHLPLNAPVSIVSHKSLEQIWGVLGILKAGGHYVPVKGNLPAGRVNELILETVSPIVLVQQEYLGKVNLPAGVNVVLLEEHVFAAESSVNETIISSDTDLAYIIFTSGSTGKPKGVMIDHRGAVNTLYDMNARFGIGASDKIFGISDLNFDLSVYDIFGTFACGATLILPTEEERQLPEAWLRYVKKEGVTVWNSVPQIVNLLIDFQEEAGGNDISSLRLYFMSGDWIPLDLPDRIKRINSHSEVISLGGATEGSIWSIYYPIDKVNPAWKSIPYGYPLGNQEMYVLDKNLQPAPLNIPGDIYIGGTGVAKGYYKDDVKTAASFIYHPEWKKLLYKTGDLGCQHPDGYMIFLGRQDGQVKINGFRVELGEIETILQQSPLVQQCVVMTIEDARRNKRLVAYVVPAATFEKDEIINYLRQHLPEYMVPSLLLEIAKVPLTANGKVNKHALPVADVSVFSSPQYVAPENETEMQLATIWGTLLKIEKPGIHDNFFELGGNSLVMIQLVHKINTTFKNTTIQLIDVMKNTSIAKLSAVITHMQQAGESLPNTNAYIITLRDGDHQEVTFIVPGGLGATEAYLDMAKQVPGTGAVYGLQMKGVPGNDTPCDSIEEMAAHNLKLMAAISASGKVNLWGHSYAGIVIYEMLKQTAGAIVTGEVVLLDCYTDPLSFSDDPTIVKLGFYFKGLIRFCGLTVSEEKGEQLVAEINHRSVEEGLRFIYDTVNVLPKEVIGRMWNVFNASVSAKYNMDKKLSNHVTVIQADNSLLTGGDWKNGEDLGWDKFFEDVTVIHTTGNHFSLVNEPHCSMWSSTLKLKIN